MIRVLTILSLKRDRAPRNPILASYGVCTDCYDPERTHTTSDDSVVLIMPCKVADFHPQERAHSLPHIHEARGRILRCNVDRTGTQDTEKKDRTSLSVPSSLSPSERSPDIVVGSERLRKVDPRLSCRQHPRYDHASTLMRFIS